MTEPKLTQNEQSLQDAVESGDYGPMVTHERRKELEAAASHTSEKDKRINIRTPNRDLSAIQAKVTEEGIPFQALASMYSDSDQNEMESLFVRTFSASEGKAEGALQTDTSKDSESTIRALPPGRLALPVVE